MEIFFLKHEIVKSIQIVLAYYFLNHITKHIFENYIPFTVLEHLQISLHQNVVSSYHMLATGHRLKCCQIRLKIRSHG